MPARSLDSRILAASLRASQVLAPGAFLDHCVESLGELMGAGAVLAYQRIAGGSDLELRTSWPEARGKDRPPALLSGTLVAGAGEDGAAVDASRMRPGGAPWPGGEGRMMMVFPIGEAAEADGVFLALSDPESETFAPAGLSSARAFLRSVRPAWKNVRLVADLRETAVRDDLAGCYNRRHFESFLGEEVARARRFRSHVSVLFLDMDDLKSVNTAHGHAMGSRSLQQVAERIDGGIRKIDKLFRFGGDEFCIVLPETDRGGAWEVAERTRSAIQSRPFLVEETGGVALSASLGVATFPEHGDTAESLVHAADRAMQAVKKSGKNATGIAPGEAGGGVPGRRSVERES
jgi:diguanylate cyclase (GGDEF)-like protein